MFKNSAIKFILSLVAAAILGGAVAMVQPVQAEGAICYGPYGQEFPCPVINKSFSIDKTTRVNDGDSWIKNVSGLNVGQNVQFKIRIENTGELDVDEVKVVDVLPNELTYVSSGTATESVQVGDNGTTVTWIVEDFNVGDVVEITLVAKTNDANLAAGGNRCDTNVASLMYQNKVEGSSSAVACVKKGDVLSERLPETASDATQLGIAIVTLLSGLLILTVTLMAEDKIKARD